MWFVSVLILSWFLLNYKLLHLLLVDHSLCIYFLKESDEVGLRIIALLMKLKLMGYNILPKVKLTGQDGLSCLPEIYTLENKFTNSYINGIWRWGFCEVISIR